MPIPWPHLTSVWHFIQSAVLGASEEIAVAAAFLASDDASFVIGEALVVDGGMLSR
jgi:NAD(P)-dependent dehydrogenase (short-subunit alcohol dehydrogenase family)